MIKIYPKCHPYWENDEKPFSPKIKNITYTARGYLLPCCWCDDVDNSEFKKLGFFDDNIKLENVNSVNDVLKSEQWVKFHKMILRKPEQAPKVCKERCSSVPSKQQDNFDEL